MRDRVEVALQVGVHHVDVALLQAARRPAAGRLCSRVRGESRSCARRSPARRSVRSRSQPPPARRGRAPWECPAVASRSFPVWGCGRGGSACGRYVPSRSCVRQFPDRVRQLLARTASPSRDPRPPPLRSPRPAGTPRSRFRSANTLSISRNHLPPFTPCSRAVNMRSVQTARFGPAPAERDLSGLCSRCRHCRRCVFRRSGHSRIHLPASLRSPGVTRLRRYYGRSDSCPAALRVLTQGQ